MKPRTFATAWVTTHITFNNEPMQILAHMFSHIGGFIVYHITCRSDGPPVYGHYQEEWGIDDRDLALEYWEGCKTKDSEVRKRIDEKFADQLGFGLPF